MARLKDEDRKLERWCLPPGIGEGISAGLRVKPYAKSAMSGAARGRAIASAPVHDAALITSVSARA